MTVHIKRIYEVPDKKDGLRVLVDRLWPRGMAKDIAHVDVWLKEIAPSAELRRWFGHEPEKWEMFIDKYSAELMANPAVKEIYKLMKTDKVITLLYAAKDTKRNNAAALSSFLKKYS